MQRTVAFRQQLPAAVDDNGVGIGVGLCLAGTLKAKQLDEYEIIQDAEGLKFETVSEHMHLIDGADYTVYIPTAKSEPFIRELQQSGPTKKLLRLLAPFAVTVYEQQFQMLKDANALILVSDNVGILCDPCFYSSDTGLKLNT